MNGSGDPMREALSELERAERRIHRTREYLSGIPESDPAYAVAQQALAVLEGEYP